MFCLYNKHFRDFLSVDGAHDIEDETRTTESDWPWDNNIEEKTPNIIFRI